MVPKSVSMNFSKMCVYNQTRQLPWPRNMPVSKKMMKLLYATKHPAVAESILSQMATASNARPAVKKKNIMNSDSDALTQRAMQTYNRIR